MVRFATLWRSTGFPGVRAAGRLQRWPRAWRLPLWVRIPAARFASRHPFAGSWALLPTYGRVSRYGLIAFASSLDRVGPITRTVRDAAILLGVIAGHDPLDATSSTMPVPDYMAALDQPVTGLRVGVPAEYFGDGLDPEVRAAVETTIEQLREAGCVVRPSPFRIPGTRSRRTTCWRPRKPAPTWPGLTGCAMVFAHRMRIRLPPCIASRATGFGAEVKRRILLGTYALSAGYYDAYYKKAQQVRTLLTQDFLTAFQDVDVLVTPRAPTPAFKLGEKTEILCRCTLPTSIP